jgi:hypothetical protein
MDNYHYIIAGLPELVLNADNSNLNYSAIRDHIVYSSAPKDVRLVEWLEFGINEENLSSHFYNAALKCKSKFIRNYFALDLEIRNRKVDFVSKKLGRDGDSLKMNVNGNVNIELSESQKDYDRNTSIETLKVLLALGFEIKKK